MNLIPPKYQKVNYFIDALFFFLVSGGALLLYAKLWGVSDRSSGNLLFQIVSLTIYGRAFIKLLTVYKYKAINIVLKTLPLFILIVFCLTSTLWSVEPFTAFRRAVALCLTYGYCLFLVSKYEIDELLYVSFLVCIYITVLGCIAVAIPGWGIDNLNSTYSTAIRGFAGHKNDFGRYVAIGILVLWYLFRSNKIATKLFVAIVCFFTMLLFLSEARTPLAVLILVILFTFLSQMYVTGKFKQGSNKIYSFKFRMLIFAIVIPIILVLIGYMMSYILEVLGKDMTLTGRTYIWQYALDFGEQHKWFGAGYRTFWVDGWGTYTFWGTHSTISNGHNGFIDVWLELGYVGFAIYLFFILSYFKFSMLPIKNSVGMANSQVFSFSLMIFYLCYSITEQMTLEQSELLWMLLMIFYMAIRKITPTQLNKYNGYR